MVPSAIFHDDEQIRKTKKSDHSIELEENGSEILVLSYSFPIPQGDAYLIDGMALIQSSNEKHIKYFNDTWNILLKKKKKIRIFNKMDMNGLIYQFCNILHCFGIR